MMKKVLGIILLVLMSTQLLSIKEMGKLLFNNQIVEEHPVDGCNDIVKLAKELKFLKQFDGSLHLVPSLFFTCNHYNFFAEIPSGPAREIHCPPPNC